MALDRIVAHKRREIAERERRLPLASLRERIVPSTRGLYRALAKPGARFIMEYKKASPSRGIIREDLTPEAAAAAYGECADAISVVVDAKFFGGDLDDLRVIRSRVRQPVLCKDIVVSPYQVFEARHHGADAVLLMLSVLDDQDYRTCLDAARRLALDVVTEIHDAIELDRAIELGARIIGINNRDLRRLEVDLDTTRRLARRVPRDRLIISESGIGNHRDVRNLCRHADAFLVGTSLMRARRVDLAARRLVHGRVKVCGHTEVRGPGDAHKAGAVYGGLVFARQSRRRVSRDQARDISERSPMPMVGVFVNQGAGEVASIAREVALDAVQLHGDEDAAYISELRRRLPDGCRVWKAIRVRGTPPRLPPAGADRVLFDGYMPALWGGTGQRFDWSMLRRRRDRGEIILAGGLAENCAAEAAAVGAWALDVSSGVESAPGVKDAAKMNAFLAALRPPSRADFKGRDG